ncbi:MAG TPA: hypothetical protein PKE29_16300 [Phycisphaerales bacterium]|nr:hypothetical protein [Phycisphaerales bacterium]
MFGRTCAAGLVLVAAGAAMGQPAVNGKLKPEYGPVQWLNTTPTGFGDAGIATAPACDPIGGKVKLTLNNSGRAGVSGDTSMPADPVAAAAVSTGYELKIPLEALGLDITGNGANLPDPVVVRVAGWMGSGDYTSMSNQFIGGLGGTPAGTSPNNYPNVRAVDLSTVPGDQYVTVSIPRATLVALASGTEPTLDGTLDPSYGAALFVQDTNTNYGDATTAQGGTDTIFRCGGGSEIDAAYGQFGKDASGEPALYLFIAGNFESNYNKLAIFFDSIAGGQNQLSSDSATQTGTFGPIFGGGANSFGTTTGVDPQPGTKFDAAFAADFFLGFGLGGSGDASPTIFADWQRLRTSPTDAGSARFIGQVQATGATPGVLTASDPCPPFVEPSYADYANGSEIDGLYAMVCGDYLYVLVTGNLENSSNRLDLFFDVGTVSVPLTSAGQNQLQGNSHPFDFGHLNRLGTDIADPTNFPGLKFSAGFAPDYWVSMSITGSPTATVTTYAGLINTLGANNDGGFPPAYSEYGSFAGGDKATNTPLVFDGLKCVRFDTLNACAPNGAGSAFNPTSIPGIDIQGDAFANMLPVVEQPYSSYAPRLISQNAFDPLGTAPGNTNYAVAGLLSTAIDNSNHGGVTGSDATNAKRVVTGLEAKIRLDELGWVSGPIRVSGFVVSRADIGSMDPVVVSNQVIGGMLASGQGNLNEPRVIDFDALAGATGPFYVTIDPGTCATVATGGCCFDSTSCVLMSSAQCAAVGGGFFAGSCTPLPCGGGPAGVCCRGATCSTAYADAAACAAAYTTATTAVSKFVPGATACNTPVTTPGMLGNTTTPCCYANYNHNASLEVQDIFDFLNDWFAGNKAAIVGGDGDAGALNVQNIFDFLNAWFAGGCV